MVLDRCEENGNPPSLAAAVNDESSEEEANENRAFHIDLVLVMASGLGKAEEEKEAANKQLWIVGEINSASEKEKVHHCDPSGDGGLRDPPNGLEYACPENQIF